MDSIYFQDPLGLLIELASYRFEPPSGATHAEVLLRGAEIRVERGDRAIEPIHVADAIELLVERRRRRCQRTGRRRIRTEAVKGVVAQRPACRHCGATLERFWSRCQKCGRRSLLGIFMPGRVRR